MSAHEFDVTAHEKIVSIPLHIGEQALAALRATQEAMDADDAPDVALVEIGSNIFTLGGSWLERMAKYLDSPLIAPKDFEPYLPSETPNTVTLMLGEKSLAALSATRDQMNGFVPPEFALVDFDGAYRLAGNSIATYVAEHGGQILHDHNLDAQGLSITAENAYN